MTRKMSVGRACVSVSACVCGLERESAIEKVLATCSLIIRHQMEEDVRGQKNRRNLFLARSSSPAH